MTDKKLNTKWLTGFEDESYKEDFRRRILMSDDIWAKLKLIIDIEVERHLKEMRKDDSFASPAWSEKQAHLLGKLNGLTFIKELLP